MYLRMRHKSFSDSTMVSYSNQPPVHPPLADPKDHACSRNRVLEEFLSPGSGILSVMVADAWAMPHAGWLSDDGRARVGATVPVRCVDFVPDRRDNADAVVAVGLILRRTPFDSDLAWCYLGGRIARGEA